MRNGVGEIGAAVVAVLALAGSDAAAIAQQRAGGTACGRAVHAATRLPLAGVTVQVEGAARHTRTDVRGRFCLELPPGGGAQLRARGMGLASAVVAVPAEPAAAARMELLLAEDPLVLPGITVTARPVAASAEGSTASRVGREAIEHLQAASLGDLLQLVPGQAAGNPTLAAAGQSLLREVPTSADAVRANALGTAVVVDGAPISNNANLQTDVTILNAAAGALPPFSSVAGRGVDLRQISPDEIESVEVVRGVPSARHGDLTAGAILVETRVGERRPELRVRLNPTLLDASLTAGWGDGGERSGWSVGATLTGAQDDPRETLENFYRSNLALAWRSPLLAGGRLSHTLRLTAFGTLDERRQDPDDLRYRRERSARDRGGRAVLSGSWRPRPASRLTWTGSAAYAEQVGFYQELVGTSITPITTARTDTTVRAEYGPSEYLNRTTVEGRPLNLYGRVEGETVLRAGGWTHRPRVGVEWRRDVNLGAGRQFDLRTPPRQNYSVGDRPRAFSDVPALQILSLYAEDRWSGTVLGREAALSTGIRFDNVGPVRPWEGRFGTALQPRLSGEVETLPGVRLVAAYGTTAKAPPLSYLFPGPRYFDLVNVNHYAADPAERLLVVTTRVVQPSNAGARLYTARKAEAGVAWRRGAASATATLFREATRGAYGWRRQVVAFPVERFGIVPGQPGQPPALTPEPVRVDTVFSAFDAPDATRRIVSTGAEFTVDLPEWTAVRTALSVNGAWIRTRSADDAPTANLAAVLGSGNPPARVGLYPTEGRQAERFLTSARLIHRLPEFGLVASGLVQTVWWERDRPTGVSPYPAAYVDRGGNRVELTPEEGRSEAMRDLWRPVSEAYGTEERRPPLWLLNLRLSKTLPAGMQMSFFANNVLADRPLYRSRRTDAFQQRNPPMAFGLELVSRLGR